MAAAMAAHNSAKVVHLPCNRPNALATKYKLTEPKYTCRRVNTRTRAGTISAASKDAKPTQK